MKKIGAGWQYSVYDLSNGRVLKKFHSKFQSYWHIWWTIFPFKNDKPYKIPDWSRGMKRTALSSINTIKTRNVPSEWIGNPKFINELDFEQDKCTPLAQIIAANTSSESMKLIDRFIEFNQKMLHFGIIDKSFNITKNYGLSGKGNIVLIDIGEIFEDPAKIERQRKGRAWAKHYITDPIRNPEMRKYFLKHMDETFGLPGEAEVE